MFLRQVLHMWGASFLRISKQIRGVILSSLHADESQVKSRSPQNISAVAAFWWTTEEAWDVFQTHKMSHESVE